MTTTEATHQFDAFLAKIHAEKDEHERRMNCKHERTEWYEDGNIGGFAKFVVWCLDCDREVPEE